MQPQLVQTSAFDMLGIFTRHTHAQQHTDKREVASTTLSATRSLGRWPPSCAAPERRRLAAAARHAALLSSRVWRGAPRPAPTHTHSHAARRAHTACVPPAAAGRWMGAPVLSRPSEGPRSAAAHRTRSPRACGRRDTCAVVAYSQPFLTRSGRLHPTVVGLRAESTFCLPFASAKALGRLTAPNCGSPRAWGRERGPASDGERRGEARGGQSRPETTPCAAVSVVDEQRCAEPRTVRRARAAGGHRAGEPAPREGAWAGRAGSRGEALWSLGAARDGDGRRQAAGAHAGCREPAVARR